MTDPRQAPAATGISPAGAHAAAAGPAGTAAAPQIPAAPMLSLVVPLHNEEDSVLALAGQCCQALAALNMPWELILVDDGSTDATSARLHEACRRYPRHVRGLILRRNFGQTAAMQAGMDQACGSLIVTMDGDLQNDPADIPRMVRRLLAEDLDLLVGWRHQRQDGLLLRKLPSWLANRLISAVTGIRLHDYGCSLKVLRAEVLQEVRLAGQMHRFIPTWIATVTSPARIAEEPVNHFARRHGRSKYGLQRVFRVLPDLAAMLFFLRYRDQPGHFFGRLGLASGSAGLALLAWLALEKLLHGTAIGTRPLLLLGALLLALGVQLLCTGLLAEMLTRTSLDARSRQGYSIRMRINPGPDRK